MRTGREDMSSHNVGAQWYARFNLFSGKCEEMENKPLKRRHWAIKTWQNAQQLCGAMKHICDNDTSGLRESRSPVNEMTVQDRCGRRNEPPPVLQFLSANKWW